MSSSKPYICFDLLLLILKFLPVKTLLQYRCVSKSLKQSIDSPSFILDHLSLQTPRILFEKHRTDLRDRDYILKQIAEFEFILPDADGGGGFYDTIRGPDGEDKIPGQSGCSVHGVICFYGNHKEIVVYNPSIRRQLRIPVPKNCRRFNRHANCCGFWMDPCSREFKVVILAFFFRRIYLYSSRKKEWAKTAIYSETVENCHSGQVLIDRVAHWTATSSSGEYVIVFYDFGEHIYGTIDMPFNKNKSYGFNAYVSKWQGLLSVMYLDRWNEYPVGGGGMMCRMPDGSWSIRARFRMSPDISQVFYLGDWSVVLASLRSYKGELVAYHLEDEAYIPLLPMNKNNSPPPNQDFAFLITPASDFVETLVFPDDCSESLAVQ